MVVNIASLEKGGVWAFRDWPKSALPKVLEQLSKTRAILGDEGNWHFEGKLKKARHVLSGAICFSGGTVNNSEIPDFGQ